MGLFDRFGSDTDRPEDAAEKDGEGGTPRAEEYTKSDDYQADSYDVEDLSDEVSVIFADRWPTGKHVVDYELIYVIDPSLEDPILLRNQVEFFMPEGCKLLLEDTSVGLQFEERTYWASSAMIVDPRFAELVDIDWKRKVPEAMEGRRINQDQPVEHEAEFIATLAEAMMTSE